MKCLLCESISLSHICQNCRQLYLQPSVSKRFILNNIPVYSFYRYDEIADLLHTKHSDLGFYIFEILASLSFKNFSEHFESTTRYSSLGIDDLPKSGYAHTAILNRALKSKVIHPEFSKLRAQNSVNYSGKSYNFRLENPRSFRLKKLKYKDVILVDDIITTGLTLTQAVQTLRSNGYHVAFCLTLANAQKN